MAAIVAECLGLLAMVVSLFHGLVFLHVAAMQARGISLCRVVEEVTGRGAKRSIC